MTYHVHDMFFSLQGEGALSGKAAVFCRFAGCNLWSGREIDRAGALCSFCDTQFRGAAGPTGGRFDRADELARRLCLFWPPEADPAERFLVCTGGEPLLQLDTPLVDALHGQGFKIAVETNGTRTAPDGIDWLCVSPKSTVPLQIMAGDELKLVFPQPDAPPERFAALDFEHFFLQPMDGPDRASNTAQAIAYCQRNPRWRLSLQLHKWLGIP